MTHPDPRVNASPVTPSVAAQLATLDADLTADLLREALLAGVDEAASITENDVITRSGYVRWSTPLRVLGDMFVPKGWSRERPGGFEILLHPGRQFAIAVTAGNPATGTTTMPHTAIPRGPLTGQAILGNHGQLRFPAWVHEDFAADEPPDWNTWFLLHYLDEDSGSLRSELSLPVELEATGFRSPRGLVTQFEPRIILPEVWLDAIHADEDDMVEEIIDVPVERRA